MMIMQGNDSNGNKRNVVNPPATNLSAPYAGPPGFPLDNQEREEMTISVQNPSENQEIGIIADEIAQLCETTREMREEIKKTQILISQWYKKNKSLFESINTPLQTLVEGSLSLSAQLTDLNGMIQDLSKSLYLHTSSSSTVQTHMDEVVNTCQKDIQKVKSELTFVFYLMGIGFVLLFIVTLMK